MAKSVSTPEPSEPTGDGGKVFEKLEAKRKGCRAGGSRTYDQSGKLISTGDSTIDPEANPEGGK